MNYIKCRKKFKQVSHRHVAIVKRKEQFINDIQENSFSAVTKTKMLIEKYCKYYVSGDRIKLGKDQTFQYLCIEATINDMTIVQQIILIRTNIIGAP